MSENLHQKVLNGVSSLRKFAGKHSKKAKIASLAMLMAATLPSEINNTYHALFPSPQRVAFEKEFGFPLKGWKKDIEENPLNVEILVDGLHKERQLYPLDDLNYVKIVPSSFFKQSLFEKVPFSFDVSGMSFMGRIFLESLAVQGSILSSTLSHELAHHAYDSFASNTLKLDWPEPAEPYDVPAVAYTKHFILSETDTLECVDHLNETCSFVSDYSKIAFIEDVACTAENLKESFFELRLFLDNNPGSDFEKKANLLQEAGLIPSDFNEYRALIKSYSRRDIPLKKNSLDSSSSKSVSISKLASDSKSISLNLFPVHFSSTRKIDALSDEYVSSPLRVETIADEFSSLYGQIFPHFDSPTPTHTLERIEDCVSVEQPKKRKLIPINTPAAQKLVTSLTEYLEDHPYTIYASSINTSLAERYYKAGEDEQAMKYYEAVLDSEYCSPALYGKTIFKLSSIDRKYTPALLDYVEARKTGDIGKILYGTHKDIKP